MFKVEWSDEIWELIGPYHDFIIDILNFVNQEPNFRIKKESDLQVLIDKINELKRDETCSYKFLDVATKTNLKKYICDLKYEGFNVLNKYNEWCDNYKEFLSGNWEDSTQYSEELTAAFKYFYTDLIHGKIFNKFIGESSAIAIKKFREKLTLESTCPYCDYHEMEFDSASVDHFIPKSRYPLFSIYPKNLVVACTACNDRIKKDNLYLPIAHPYYDNLDDYFYFTYKNDLIGIEFYDHISSKNIQKVRNFFLLFNLEERYNINCKKKLTNLKVRILLRVTKQTKGLKNISIEKIQSIIKDEIDFEYFVTLDNKKKDTLTKLKLDFLNQMKENLSDLSSYIASENGNFSLELEDSFLV